jgi:hypothetical protein
MSSTNKILKNASETKIHKATEEIRNNAITLGFLAFNTLYYSNYGTLDAMHIQCVVITKIHSKLHSGNHKRDIIGVRIILKWILKRKEMRMWTPVQSHQIGLRGGIYKQWNISQVS